MRGVQLRDANATLSAPAERSAGSEAPIIARCSKLPAAILEIEDRLRDIPFFGRLLFFAPLEDADPPPCATMRNSAF